MLIQILLLSFAFPNWWSGFSVALAQSAAGASSSLVSTTTSTSSPTSIAATASFPPIGSIPRDYTPEGLERLWDIVGPVEPPPFTTTRVPSAAAYRPLPLLCIHPSMLSVSNSESPRPRTYYQVEGATKNEGKGPIMWDWESRQPNGIFDNTTGDVVDLHYFLYKEDVQRIAALGVTAHSFSISWARIYPFGAADSPINTAGIPMVQFHPDIIDYHLAHGVEPVVTLFHWDTPLALQAYYEGFTSPEIIDDFVDYAKTVFKAYNGRVKTWYTFNEPRDYCDQLASYPFNATLAPGVNSSTAPYQCAYNLCPCKSRQGIPCNEYIRRDRLQKRQLHVTMSLPPATFTQPEHSPEAHHGEATLLRTHLPSNATQHSKSASSQTPFTQLVTGPTSSKTLPAEYLPRFTDQEKSDLLGSADFFAIDAYRSLWVKAPDEGIDACVANPSHPLWPVCNEPAYFDSDYGWPAGPAGDPLATPLQETPLAIRPLLKGLHSRWPTNKMYISECWR
ncbi:uncharacterized protein ARMOST_12423 [Armillaria ostoyae]|uniref:Beta-glucosidase n=1 Tax=Armillaria ostoyae TaxID=47428 RepID=A0A284RK00_ARMOS|nr:uncharacterized protein ARMOST_12423 [Armillaria ostoyae]